MKYKKSKYIISNIDKSNNNLYLYHTDTGSIIYVDAKKEENLNDILNDPNTININKKLKNILIESGFIVPEDYDEYQQVQYKILNRNYDKAGYLELTIMPTEQCNFRCIYCYEKFKKPTMNSFYQEAIINYVKREIVNRKGLKLSWFGGEPLLAMSVIEYLSKELIKICEENKKPFHATITTNGYLLDLATFEKLRKLRINHFQVTLDGFSITHDKQRVLINGKPTFSKIFENLCNIRDHAKGRIWSVSLRTNVTKTMLTYLSEYIELIQKNFNNDRRFTIMIRKMWTNGTDGAENIYCENDDFYDFIASCATADYTISQDYFLTHGQNFICYAAKPYAFVIGSDGSLYKCTVAMEDENNQIGIINENGIFQFDQNKLAKWTIPKIEKLSHCSSCSFFAACGGNSCPLRKDTDNCDEIIDRIVPNIKNFVKYAKISCDITELI